uniref:Uncharacterized protein n=1 Tax=Picea glauca TaxID=3330 RepID=A0A101M294_PICGL|nr:hypothetical protein ABT39_MTgene2971 [Picea glauca]
MQTPVMFKPVNLFLYYHLYNNNTYCLGNSLLNQPWGTW